jgi:hypothetical protein
MTSHHEREELTMKIKNPKALPTTVELFQGTRSAVAMAAIFRSGGGKHADKRRAKARKHDWKRDAG